MYQVVR